MDRELHLNFNGRIILKRDLKKIRYDDVACIYLVRVLCQAHFNKAMSLRVPLKGGEFHYQLGYSQLLNNVSAPLSS
jgi:hypothetical protein